jgi:hypothetical protein
LAWLRRVRLLGSWGGRVAWIVASRHYLSVVSAGVLAVLTVLVLTSDSFEDRNSGPGERSGVVRDQTRSGFASQPRAPRPVVLFYLVNDAAQRDELSAAVDADRSAVVADSARPDYIFYLIAGTKEEEVSTIERLNFEELLARTGGVEMRVIDVRDRFD